MKIAKIVKEDGVSHMEVNNVGLLGGITATGVVTTILTVLTFFLVELPSSKLEGKRLEVELYNMVLRDKNDTSRIRSMKFLIATDLIKETNELTAIILSGSLPDWSDLPKDIISQNSDTTSNSKSDAELSSNKIPISN